MPRLHNMSLPALHLPYNHINSEQSITTTTAEVQGGRDRVVNKVFEPSVRSGEVSGGCVCTQSDDARRCQHGAVACRYHCTPTAT